MKNLACEVRKFFEKNHPLLTRFVPLPAPEISRLMEHLVQAKFRRPQQWVTVSTDDLYQLLAVVVREQLRTILERKV